MNIRPVIFGGIFLVISSGTFAGETQSVHRFKAGDVISASEMNANFNIVERLSDTVGALQSQQDQMAGAVNDAKAAADAAYQEALRANQRIDFIASMSLLKAFAPPADADPFLSSGVKEVYLPANDATLVYPGTLSFKNDDTRPLPLTLNDDEGGTTISARIDGYLVVVENNTDSVDIVVEVESVLTLKFSETFACITYSEKKTVDRRDFQPAYFLKTQGDWLMNHVAVRKGL